MEGSPLRKEEVMRRVFATVVLSVLLLWCGRLAAGQVSHEELNVQLIEAAKTGNTQAARQVFPFGASPDAKDENGVTALMWAAGNGKIEMIKFLLDKGADFTAKDKDGHTALDRAKANGQIEAAKVLRRTASVHRTPGTGQSGSTTPK